MWVVVTTHHDADEGDEEGEDEDEVAVGVEQPAASPLAARPRAEEQGPRLHQETPAGEGPWPMVREGSVVDPRCLAAQPVGLLELEVTTAPCGFG